MTDEQIREWALRVKKPLLDMSDGREIEVVLAEAARELLAMRDAELKVVSDLEKRIVEAVRFIGVKAGVSATVYGEMCHEIRSILATAPSNHRDAEAKQAEIDRLMLEFCPEEMTPEQIENWKKHQVAVSPEVSAAIDSARDGQEEGHG